MTSLLGVSAAGMAATLLFAAKAAITWLPPSAAGAEVGGSSGADKAALTRHNAALAASALAAMAPLALSKSDPLAFGEAMALPAGLAWSVLGFLAGRGPPGQPPCNWLGMLLGALAANVGASWHGQIIGWDYLTAMSTYFGQVRRRCVCTRAHACLRVLYPCHLPCCLTPAHAHAHVAGAGHWSRRGTNGVAGCRTDGPLGGDLQAACQHFAARRGRHGACDIAVHNAHNCGRSQPAGRHLG